LTCRTISPLSEPLSQEYESPRISSGQGDRCPRNRKLRPAPDCNTHYISNSESHGPLHRAARSCRLNYDLQGLSYTDGMFQTTSAPRFSVPSLYLPATLHAAAAHTSSHDHSDLLQPRSLIEMGLAGLLARGPHRRRHVNTPLDKKVVGLFFSRQLCGS